MAKTFEELRQAYKELLADNQQLIADNRKLRNEVAELKQLNDCYVKIIAKNQETNNKLMASVQKKTDGDYISRADAIDAVKLLQNTPNGYSDTFDKACIIGLLEELPSADAVQENNEIIKAIHTINNFLNTQGVFLATSMWRAKDGTILSCDWGYFDEGMREIEKYLKGGAE